MSVLAWGVVWSTAILALLAIAATASGYVLIRRKLAAISYQSDSVTGHLATRFEALTTEVFDCRRRLTELDGRYTPVAEQAQLPASLHLNRRGQVLQLYRRGESPRKIAAALGMSQGEVKLIIRVIELNPEKEPAKPRNNLNRKRSRTLDTDSGPQKGEA